MHFQPHILTSIASGNFLLHVKKSHNPCPRNALGPLSCVKHPQHGSTWELFFSPFLLTSANFRSDSLLTVCCKMFFPSTNTF